MTALMLILSALLLSGCISTPADWVRGIAEEKDEKLLRSQVFGRAVREQAAELDKVVIEQVPKIVGTEPGRAWLPYLLWSLIGGSGVQAANMWRKNGKKRGME